MGGVDAASTEAAVAFYRAALDGARACRPCATPETAELVKLMETTYRDVNIALANEFARFAAARGLPVDEAIAAANTQPYSHIHRPGIGVGGHCIPVYPYFLINADPAGDLTLPRAARQANDGMAGWALDRLSLALGGLAGRAVLILGYSYRENVKEPAFSAANAYRATCARRAATPLLSTRSSPPDELAAAGAAPGRIRPPCRRSTRRFCRPIIARSPTSTGRRWPRAAAARCSTAATPSTRPPRPRPDAGMTYLGIGR